MKQMFLVLLLIGVTVSSYAQFNARYPNKYFDVKFTVDPGVLINEQNFNIKIEASTHFNGHAFWRANAVLETLTGEEHGGYYGVDVGVGYSMPYNIGKWRFKIEPGIGIGLIFRPEMGMLVTRDENGARMLTNEGFLGASQTLNLRHSLNLFGSKWSVYIHNRFIWRSDLHMANSLTETPEDLPWYEQDNAIGIKYEWY